MFEIKNVKSKISFNVLKQKLEEYVASCDNPSFFEFLNSLGILWSEWLELSKNVGSPSVRLLLRYKEYLESQMEKLLVYQNKNNYYNYKELEFVLAKSNPTKYGAVAKKEEKVIKNKIANFEFGSDLQNVSEVKLLEKIN